MKIELRYFAAVRELLGMGQEPVIVPEHVQTVGELRDYLCLREGRWREALQQPALRMACNQVMCFAETPLRDGCEVAFFPPVTGG